MNKKTGVNIAEKHGIRELFRDIRILHALETI